MKYNILKSSIFSVIFVLGFLWINNFVLWTSGITGSRDLNYLAPAMGAVIMTIFLYWLTLDLLNDLEWEGMFTVNSKTCWTAVGILSVVLVIAAFLEGRCEAVSLFGRDVKLFIYEIPKEFLHDVWAIIMFPLGVELILKSTKEDGLSKKNILGAFLQILILSAAGLSIFWVLDRVWFLMTLNVFTVAVAIHKYMLNSDVKKRYAVGFLLLYVFIWIVAIYFMNRETVGIASMNEWDKYVDGVQLLVGNASFVGTSDALMGMESIHTALCARDNFLQQLFFYGGKLSVIGAILFMIGFLVSSYKMLGMRRYYWCHKHQIMYMSAWFLMLIRCLMGTLYAFAIIPVPIRLPFSGIGSFTDSICFSLLLICAYQNYQTDELKEYRLLDAEELLESDNMEYTVLDNDTGEPYDEELYCDEVTVQGKEKQINCVVTWPEDFLEGYAVFEPQKNRKKEVFILKHNENGIWESVKDKECCVAVFLDYIRNRIPTSMEMEVTYGKNNSEN